MFQVCFQYDESARKWEVVVQGAGTEVEARQGFAAVVQSCHQIDPALQKHAPVDLTTGKLQPAVMPAPHGWKLRRENHG